jgi:Tol biopolymer transport system component
MRILMVIMVAAVASVAAASSAGAQGATIPAPSPDGKLLAFGSTRAGTSQVYVLDLHTGVVRQVTHDSGSNRHPTWSPDGRRLAFESTVGRTSSVRVVDLAGGPSAPLTPDGTFATNPAWSPDGRWVAVSAGAFPDLDLWLYPADGKGTPLHLTRGPAADYWPAWAPGGTQLAFVQAFLIPGEGIDQPRSGIAMVDVGGRNHRLILADTSGISETPAFSPDGHSIAFQMRHEKRFTLYTMRIDGSAVTPLRTVARSDEAPACAVDPPRLYFQSRAPGDSTFAIWVMDPRGINPAIRVVP